MSRVMKHMGKHTASIPQLPIETLRALNMSISVKHVSVNTRVVPAAVERMAPYCTCTLCARRICEISRSRASK